MEIQLQDFPKLVRDKMVEEKREKAGPDTRIETTDDPVKKSALLVKKVLEEALEMQTISGRESFVSEIADILEAVEALKKVYDISDEDTKKAMEAKRDIQGGYEGGHILIQ